MGTLAGIEPARGKLHRGDGAGAELWGVCDGEAEGDCGRGPPSRTDGDGVTSEAALVKEP